MVSCYLLLTVLELGVVPAQPSPAQPKSTPVDSLAKVREEAVASAVLSWASIASTCKLSVEDWATSGTVQILIQQAGITSPSKSNYHTALTLMGTLRSGPGEAHKHRTGVPNLASLPKFLSPPCSQPASLSHAHSADTSRSQFSALSHFRPRNRNWTT